MSQPRRPALLRRAVTGWALLGGGVLCLVVLINLGAALAPLIGRSVAGDYELTEMLTAIAVFMFLPYTQISGGHVSADIFTLGAGAATRRALAAAAAALAAGFAALLIWRMWFGMLDQKAYAATTTILQIPIWLAYAPILISLALLLLSAAQGCARALIGGRARD